MLLQVPCSQNNHELNACSPAFRWNPSRKIEPFPTLPFSSLQKRATDECHFLERLESNNYNTYRSRKYPNMYVALKRTGQYKCGSKTGPGQKAILFLPMSAMCWSRHLVAGEKRQDVTAMKDEAVRKSLPLKNNCDAFYDWFILIFYLCYNLAQLVHSARVGTPVHHHDAIILLLIISKGHRWHHKGRGICFVAQWQRLLRKVTVEGGKGKGKVIHARSRLLSTNANWR